MPQFIFRGKVKDWEKEFKKEFGDITPDTTLQDVVNHKRESTLGNHVDTFIKEKNDANRGSQTSKSKKT